MASADTASGIIPLMTGPGPKIDPDDLLPTSSWASLAVRKNVAAVQDGIQYLPDANGGKYRPVKDTLYDSTLPPFTGTKEVGIVGAGCAGLFTAMLFDYLKENFQVNVKYTILEAVDDDKEPPTPEKKPGRRGVGGRLYTYYFDKQDDTSKDATSHQYYDVGGMRFPDNPMMEKTFQLFKYLGMDEYKKEFEDNDMKGDITKIPKGQLIPYILTGDVTPLLYNGIQLMQLREGDKFVPEATAEAFKITGLPRGVMKRDPGAMVSDSIEPYRAARIKYGTQAFWDDLMRKGDRYSVRQYLSVVENYDFDTIEFLETMNFGSRWYDQAFSEMVIDDLEFAYQKKTNWFCVMGGAQQLCYKMRQDIERKLKPNDKRPVGGTIQFKKIVDEIEYVTLDGDRTKPANGKRDFSKTKVAVTLQGDNEPSLFYDAVFNSASLGAQGHMKLEDLNLNWGTKQAIRSLGYSASCKVGIKFKSLWWIEKYKIEGGVGRSDLPSGFCVYPSYNVQDPVNQPGVLLCSYTWGQQAEKLGSLIGSAGTQINEGEEYEKELKRVLLHSLARLHTKTEEAYQTLHRELWDLYESHYSYDWYNDPYTAGAFAYFGPGQFQNMWQWVTRASGKYVILGEAASSHHAWVVGSLESAVRGVYQFLFAHSEDWKEASNALLAYVGKDENGIKNPKKMPEGPFGPVPEEFNRTGEADYPEDEDVYPGCSPIAELARQQVAIEKMRLELGGDQLNSGLVGKSMVEKYYGTARTKTTST